MQPYTIQAIPTVYRGITFRSRLEATWARFFDGLGWDWHYEPFERRGWIPDFAIASVLNAPLPVLAEVKPITAFDESTASKIDHADSEHEVLLLGCGPLNGNESVGWLRDLDELDWSFAPLGIWSGSESEEKNPSRTIGFCHADQSFRDRITGCYDGGCFGDGAYAHPRISVQSRVGEAWGRAKLGTRYESAGGIR